MCRNVEKEQVLRNSRQDKVMTNRLLDSHAFPGAFRFDNFALSIRYIPIRRIIVLNPLVDVLAVPCGPDEDKATIVEKGEMRESCLPKPKPKKKKPKSSGCTKAYVVEGGSGRDVCLKRRKRRRR